ncbi:hypothetical protein AB0J66_43760, partial [Actinoplanes sp. NPDC049598]|uniref:hypothetical protein n=1 Tax=Actinoplanes sp. NPDC049598 TaxID=3154626 RepID=UPI0034235615
MDGPGAAGCDGGRTGGGGPRTAGGGPRTAGRGRWADRGRRAADGGSWTVGRRLADLLHGHVVEPALLGQPQGRA